MTDKNRPKTRKDRIMDAALRIFAEKGFQNATITEISKAAGVSEATIYEYFGTKEDLLFAIPEKIPTTHLRNLQRSFPTSKAWKAKSERFCFSMSSSINLIPTTPHWFSFN